MYTFVFKNGGWWLKITDMQTLSDFHKKTDHIRFGDAYLFHLDAAESRTKANHSTYRKAEELDRAIELVSERHGVSYVESAAMLMDISMRQQADLIKERGGIYVNSYGGYHGIEKESVQHVFCHSEKLVWPKLTKKDIRITQFPDGKHYYARVGNVEVRDENGIKWNSYEEAYARALELLSVD